MKSVPISSVAEIIAGQSPPSSTYSSEPIGLPFYQGKVDFGDWNPRTRLWCSEPTKVAKEGDVLISVRAPVGPTNLATERCCIGRGLAAIRPNQDVLDSRFAIHFLRSIEREVAALGRGSTFSAITTPELKKIEIQIPIKNGKPDLVEQKRIAAILDKADAIRRKRQQALRLTDDFLRSVFLDMFGDPLTNTHQLPMRPLRDFGEIVTGNTPPRSEPENYGEALEWIKSDNINTPSYYLTSASERLSSIGAAKARRVPANSILVTCIAGSPSCIGNVAMTDREVAFNQQINAVVPSDSVDPGFLFTQFLVGKKKIQNASTNGMKGMVSKGTFSEIGFIAPTEDKQREFGRIFRVVKDLQRRNQEAFNAEELLFSSLQQRAFSGQL
jgi:type I restriction enzyme S subunit